MTDRPDLVQVLQHYGIDVNPARAEQLGNLIHLLDMLRRPGDDCLEWDRGKFPHGYGSVKIPGVGARGAHRIAHFVSTGETPPVVRHKCDNPPCVNPRHLIGGSPRDNTMDAVERGRLAAGETHGCAKLTWDKVREIRGIEGMLVKEIAPLYGVAPSTVAMIRRGVTWKERR